MTDEAPRGFGYRVWMVKEFSLTSIAVPSSWSPGVNKASCLLAPPTVPRLVYRTSGGFTEETLPAPHHKVPGKNCMCGLWSVNHLEKADSIMRSYHRQHVMSFVFDHICLKGDLDMGSLRVPPFVIGAVRYWGRTAIHDDGVRAEYAQPIALTARQSDTVERLAQKYDIPCLPTNDELAAYVRSQ